MTAADIPGSRLFNQGIHGPTRDHPADLVGWMGMMQAQDYLGALWAVGLRLRHATEVGIERAIAERQIVRTWPARGTLHFVTAADARWMLELLTPRVIARSAGRFRQLELDEPTFARSREVITQALQGHHQLPRDALYRHLETARISTAGQRGIHILGRLAQEGLICFGVRHGKQHTFTLLEEWLPPAPRLERDQALAELTRRYFTSHGPATLHDFVWWSGLTTADARVGLEMVGSDLRQAVMDGQMYSFAPSALEPLNASSMTHLLPAFDEYLVGYKDRSAVLDASQVKRINAGGGMLSPVIVINGRVLGTWKRALKKKSVVITPDWFAPPRKAHEDALESAAVRYGAFLGLPIQV